LSARIFHAHSSQSQAAAQTFGGDRIELASDLVEVSKDREEVSNFRIEPELNQRNQH
jgi:hypothetical protein